MITLTIDEANVLAEIVDTESHARAHIDRYVDQHDNTGCLAIVSGRLEILLPRVVFRLCQRSGIGEAVARLIAAEHEMKVRRYGDGTVLAYWPEILLPISVLGRTVLA